MEEDTLRGTQFTGNLEIDENFKPMEIAKRHWFESLSPDNIIQSLLDLKNIIGEMLSILVKYYPEDKANKKPSRVLSIKINNYNIVDVYNNLSEDDDIDTLREGARIAFTCYNTLIKPFVKIPTTSEDWRSKLINSMYAIELHNYNPDGYKKFMATFYRAYDFYGFSRNSVIDFYSFCLSRLSEYDLDGFLINVGDNRSGKSTLMLQLVRRIILFKRMQKYILDDIDNWLEKTNFVETHIAFKNYKQYHNSFSQLHNDIICADELSYIADRRMSMYQQNIESSKFWNYYAYKDNIVIGNMRNLSDVDMRTVNKAGQLCIISGRGMAYLYAKRVNVPITKDYFGFEPFVTGKIRPDFDNVLSTDTFIAKMPYQSLDGNKVFEHYKRVKNEAK